MNSFNRRTFLSRSLGIGAASIIAPLHLDIMAAAPQKTGFLKDKLHYKPKIKRVIHLCMVKVNMAIRVPPFCLPTISQTPPFIPIQPLPCMQSIRSAS